MTVSVIVPAYNIEKELPRCLDSLLAQSWTALEIVVVNDGSSDGTGKVIDTYAVKDSRVIPVHKENGGVTSARLAGIEAATGELIGFVDGDDEVESGMYEMLVRELTEQQADIAHCGYRFVFADGRTRLFHGTGQRMVMDWETGLRELITGARVEPTLCTKLYRRELLRSALSSCPMDTTIKNYEDFLMNYWLFSKAERSVFYDVCPYHYLVRSTSASRAKLSRNRIFDPLKVKRMVCDHAPESLRADAIRSYVGLCMDTYNLILAEKGSKTDRREIRAMLAAEKSAFSLLSRKRRIMGSLILHAGGLYAAVYRLYKLIRPNSIYQ